MTRNPTTVAELIGLWPSAEQFSKDLGLKHASHGRIMKLRGSIGRRHWDQVVVSASRRDIEGVSHRLLENLHEGRRVLSTASAQSVQVQP